MTEVAPADTHRRLRRYARRYWGLIAIGMLAMALEAAASAGTLKLLGPIVDDIFVDKDFSYWLPAGLVLLLLARGLFGLIADYTIARSGRGVARDLRLLPGRQAGIDVGEQFGRFGLQPGDFARDVERIVTAHFAQFGDLRVKRRHLFFKIEKAHHRAMAVRAWWPLRQSGRSRQADAPAGDGG